VKNEYLPSLSSSKNSSKSVQQKQGLKYNVNHKSDDVIPPALRKALERRAYRMLLLLFFVIFNDFSQNNYLHIYLTDIHPICSDGRTLPSMP